MKIIKTEENDNLVLYHNNLSDLALKDFTAKERDLLMALCSRMKDLDTTSVEIPFTEVRRLSNYKLTSNKVLAKDLDSMTDKLMALKMKAYNDDGDIRKFVLFPGFRISEKNGTLTVRVGEEFVYLINSLGTNFTSFQLEEHTRLKSVWSKECYRQMMRFRDTGVWMVSAEKFREFLGLSETYRDLDIQHKVLVTVDSELAPLFEKYESCIEYFNGKVSKYVFRFSRGENFVDEEQSAIDASLEEMKEADEAARKRQEENARLERIKDRWNELAEGTAIPSIRLLTDARKRNLKARIKETDEETVMSVIERVFRNSFLRGERNKSGEHENWTATFDFVMNKSGFHKILEGNYDDNKCYDAKQELARKNREELMRKLGIQGG